MDRGALGERTITLDCDVLQADGGTRTAAITGAYVALVDAVRWLQAKKDITKNPVIGAVAAVSVGVWRGIPVLDLDYPEDVSAGTDMNVVATGDGELIEVQGTAEGAPFSRAELDALLDLALELSDAVFIPAPRLGGSSLAGAGTGTAWGSRTWPSSGCAGSRASRPCYG